MDANASAKESAASAQFVNLLGRNRNARAEILARHQFLFTGPFRGSRLQTTILRLRFLGPVAAGVESEAQLTGYVTLPPGARETSPGGGLRSRYLHGLMSAAAPCIRTAPQARRGDVLLRRRDHAADGKPLDIVDIDRTLRDGRRPRLHASGGLARANQIRRALGDHVYGRAGVAVGCFREHRRINDPQPLQSVHA